jgi:hypothetical protein
MWGDSLATHWVLVGCFRCVSVLAVLGIAPAVCPSPCIDLYLQYLRFKMFSIGRKETNRLTRRNLEKHQREIELHGSEQGNRTQASDDLEEHRLDRRSAGKQARCEDGECSEYNGERTNNVSIFEYYLLTGLIWKTS